MHKLIAIQKHFNHLTKVTLSQKCCRSIVHYKPATAGSNFTAGAATWRTRQNIMLSLILPPLTNCAKTRHNFHKTGST